MRVKVWVGGCLTAAVAAAGAAWFTVAAQEAGTTHAVCGPGLGRDDVVAAQSKAVAVVEAVENTRYREVGGSAYLTTRVKTLDTLKGEFGDVLDVTQGVKNGGTPGRYATEDPDRLRGAGARPPVRHRGPVRIDGRHRGRRGVGLVRRTGRGGRVGEREHWQEALASPPEASVNSSCDDMGVPAG